MYKCIVNYCFGGIPLAFNLYTSYMFVYFVCGVAFKTATVPIKDQNVIDQKIIDQKL